VQSVLKDLSEVSWTRPGRHGR
jgi:hypothetical protein